MTDAEKDALTWLDRMLACSNPGTDAERSVLTLKAMVAEPRLPAEPSEEVADVMRGAWIRHKGPAESAWYAIHRALYAHLTAPKTKTVEVWHVEFFGINGPSILVRDCKVLADDEADRLRVGGCKCIHVTGPHKQTVPAT